MGHIIRWDNDDKTVVLQEYTHGASKDDLYALVRESARMLHTVKHTVHLIIDEREVSILFNTIDMAYIEQWMPKNQGTVIIVVAPSSQKYKAAMVELGSRIQLKSFSNVYFSASIEQAQQFLQENFDVSYCAENSMKIPNQRIGS